MCRQCVWHVRDWVLSFGVWDRWLVGRHQLGLVLGLWLGGHVWHGALHSNDIRSLYAKFPSLCVLWPLCYAHLHSEAFPRPQDRADRARRKRCRVQKEEKERTRGKESLWLLEAPVRKIILQMHTPGRTNQCWSQQT